MRYEDKNVQRAFDRFDAQGKKIKEQGKRLREKLEKVILESPSASFSNVNKIKGEVKRQYRVIRKQFIEQMKIEAKRLENELKKANLWNSKQKQKIILDIENKVSELDAVVAMLEKKAISVALYVAKAKSEVEVLKALSKMYAGFESNLSSVSITSKQHFFKERNFEIASVQNDFFTYIGPDDKVTRNQCKARLRKGMTQEQARIANQIMLNYYNCRHQIVSITKQEYDLLPHVSESDLKN